MSGSLDSAPPSSQRIRFPLTVYLIVANEGCERHDLIASIKQSGGLGCTDCHTLNLQVLLLWSSSHPHTVPG